MTLRRATTSTGRVLRCLAAAGLVAGATTVAAVAAPAAAHAEGFASAANAPIHPGVMVTSPAGQCTANFVFSSGETIYLGQAAHCTGTGSANETDGCKSKSLGLGTEIKIQGASRPGKLVYNSWLTMRDKGESDPDTCAYNDFALVEVDSADTDKVNPTVPVFGGPTGLRDSGLPAGAAVYSYQNSSLRQGVGELSPKQGINLGDSAHGYTHEVATISPGVPGDSGSGFMDADGKAFGILSTLNLDPAPGTNGVGDLAKELAYANDNADLHVRLEKGTAPFHPPLPILGLASSQSRSQGDSDGSDDSDPAQTAAEHAHGTAPNRGMAITPRRSDPAEGDSGQHPDSLLGGQ
jgi:hypothetical protein